MRRPLVRTRLAARRAVRPVSDLLRALAPARLRAADRQPYLASALFAATPRATPGTGTISVDAGWTLRVDPALLPQLSTDELARLLLHLTGHLVRDHAARARRQDVAADPDGRARWNRAADAELNDDLRHDDLVPACAPTLPADLGQPDGGLAENYYADGAPGPRPWDCGPGADGRQDGDGLDPEQQDRLRMGVAAAVHREAGQRPGSVPAGWRRWAEHVLPARADWRRVLAAEIRGALALISGNVDYSYRRPSRRTQPGVILPSLRRPVPELAIVCDTSGSMHEALLGRALSEVDAILTRSGVRAGRVPVLAVDTAVHTARRVTRAAQVQLAGGGGTDMGAGLTAAAALRPRPRLIIVLTDGWTPWPELPPRGARVVVGLLAEAAYGIPSTPDWARTVLIDDR